MRNTNKIVALLLCLTLLVSAMSIFASAATEAPAEAESQAEVLEPNYTASKATAKAKFRSIIKSNVAGNEWGTTTYSTNTLDLSDYAAWEILKYNGTQSASFHPTYIAEGEDGTPTVTNSPKIQFDIVPKEKSYLGETIYLVQFDMIKTGKIDSDATLYFYGRPDGTKSGVYAVSKGYAISSILSGVAVGELAQITIVLRAYREGDIVDGAPITSDRAYGYLYVNGALKYTYERNFPYTVSASNSSSGEAFDATLDTTVWTNVRLLLCNSGKGANVILDNMYNHTYPVAEADTVLGEGNFPNDAYNQFANEDYVAAAMPPMATLNGVEYYNVATLNTALAACETVANLEFLHDYTAATWATGTKVAVSCNATIKTNGFVDAEDLDLSTCKYSVNGNVITTIAYSSSAMAPADLNDNVKVYLKSPDAANEGMSTSSIASSYNKDIFTLNTAGGKTFLSIADNPDVSDNGQFDINMGKRNANNSFANYPYQIMQFESGRLTDASIKQILAMIISDTTGGNSGSSVNTSTLYNGLELGEVAQFTFFFYADTAANKVYLNVYRDGVKLDADRDWNISDFTKSWASALRINMGAGTNIILGNVYTRHIATDPRVTVNGKVTFGEYDQFTKESFESIMPTLATIDGKEYGTVQSINDALANYYDAPVSVEFVTDYTFLPWTMGAKVKVGRTATINTNGYVTADALTLPEGYTVSGNTIYAFCPNTTGKVYNTTASDKTTVANAINSPVAGNNGVAATWAETTTGDVRLIQNGTNKYLGLVDADKSATVYFAATNASAPKASESKYMVMQFDAARLTDDNTGEFHVYLGIKPSGSGSNTVIAFTPDYKTVLKNVPKGEVAQLTFVFWIDVETGVVGVEFYCNGDYTTPVYRSSKDNYKDRILANPDACYVYGIRNFVRTAEMAMDNVYIYNTNEAPIVDGVLLKDQFTDSAYTKLELAPVALVDGVAYTYDNIDAVLQDGAEHTVELLHNPARKLTVASNATIKANGYADRILAGTGYLMTEADGVVTVTADVRTTNVKVTVDGQEITTFENALYNSNHESMVRALADFMYNGSVYVKDGKYYELTWDFAKREYAEEITYNATLTYHKLLVVDTVNNAVVSGTLTYEGDTLTGGKFNDRTTALYFNEDITSNATSGTFSFGDTTWYMNGYSYNFNNTTDVHGLTMVSGKQATIIGGTFNIVCKGTSGFFMTSNGSSDATSLTFENVEINISGQLADWRAGTLTFNNCKINGGYISIGARTNTNTYINFNNSTVKAESTYISYFDNNAFGYGQGTLALLPNVDRNVTFTNSKVYVYGSLSYMPTDAVEVAEGDYNHRHVIFNNSEVYAQNTSTANDLSTGRVIFGEGTKYAISHNTHNLVAAEGVALGVRTDDGRFDYVATSQYATVNWTNRTELWAAGTTPVASSAADKNLQTRPVVAGETVTFEASLGAAAEYALVANLFLSNRIFYNIYAPADATVVVNGETLAYNAEKGRFSYELIAKYALGNIDIVITFADGSVYSKATDLMEYITESAAKDYTYKAELVALYANLLDYVIKVQKYDYAPLAYAAASQFVTNNAPVVADEVVTYISENINDYFESAFFYLDGEVDLVLRTKSDLGQVTVTVGEFTAVVNAEEGILVVTLPAYVLTEEIVITVAEGTTVSYSLGAYVNSLTATNAQNAATALYNYAFAAKAYEDASNAQ